MSILINNAGVWIDHRKALIVFVSEGGETLIQIDSNVEKHVRSAGGSRSKSAVGPQSSAPDNAIDRKFSQQLNVFYKEVMDSLSDAASLLILGPGEAKLELQKQIKSKNKSMLARVAAVETADKMTDGQLKAKVRNFFLNVKKSK